MNSSAAAINSMIFSCHASSPSNAFNADTRTTGALSPSNSYSFNNSRTSSSTNSSNSSSSTASALFNATMIDGTPT